MTVVESAECLGFDFGSIDEFPVWLIAADAGCAVHPEAASWHRGASKGEAHTYAVTVARRWGRRQRHGMHRAETGLPDFVPPRVVRPQARQWVDTHNGHRPD
jgi:hypothetical protein